MEDELILSEENRVKLDGIVSKMVANNESDESIRFVVEDFKGIYGVKKKESSDSQESSQLAPEPIDSKSPSSLEVPKPSLRQDFFTGALSQEQRVPLVEQVESSRNELRSVEKQNAQQFLDLKEQGLDPYQDASFQENKQRETQLKNTIVEGVSALRPDKAEMAQAVYSSGKPQQQEEFLNQEYSAIADVTVANENSRIALENYLGQVREDEIEDAKKIYQSLDFAPTVAPIVGTLANAGFYLLKTGEDVVDMFTPGWDLDFFQKKYETTNQGHKRAMGIKEENLNRNYLELLTSGEIADGSRALASEFVQVAGLSAAFANLYGVGGGGSLAEMESQLLANQATARGLASAATQRVATNFANSPYMAASIFLTGAANATDQLKDMPDAGLFEKTFYPIFAGGLEAMLEMGFISDLRLWAGQATEAEKQLAQQTFKESLKGHAKEFLSQGIEEGIVEEGLSYYGDAVWQYAMRGTSPDAMEATSSMLLGFLSPGPAVAMNFTSTLQGTAAMKKMPTLNMVSSQFSSDYAKINRLIRDIDADLKRGDLSKEDVELLQTAREDAEASIREMRSYSDALYSSMSKEDLSRIASIHYEMNGLVQRNKKAKSEVAKEKIKELIVSLSQEKKAIEQKYTEQDGRQKEAGVPSPVEAGQAPIEAQPVQEPSVETPTPSGVVQETLEEKLGFVSAKQEDIDYVRSKTKESEDYYISNNIEEIESKNPFDRSRSESSKLGRYGRLVANAVSAANERLGNTEGDPSILVSRQISELRKQTQETPEVPVFEVPEIIAEPAVELTEPEKASVSDAVVFVRGNLASGQISETAAITMNRALRTAYNVNPNLKLVVHKTQKSLTESHADATNITEGYYNAADNTIHIIARNLNKDISDAESRVLRHEIIHPILNAELSTNPKLQAKFVSQIERILSDGIIKDSAEAEKVRKTFEKFGATEGITEFLAQFTSPAAFRAVENNPTLMDRIKAFLNKLIKRIFPNAKYQLNTNQEVYDFLSGLKVSFETGKAFKTASTTAQAQTAEKIQASTEIVPGIADVNIGKHGVLPVDDIVSFEDGVPVGIDQRFVEATPMFEALSEKLGIPFIYVNSPGADYTSKLITTREMGTDMVSLENEMLNAKAINGMLAENGYKNQLPDGQEFAVVINTAARNPDVSIRTFAAYFSSLIKPTKGFRALVSKVNGKAVETPTSVEDILVADAQEALAQIVESQPELDRQDAVMKAIVSGVENVLRLQSGLEVSSKQYTDINNIPVIQEMKGIVNNLAQEKLQSTPYFIDDVDLGGNFSSLVEFMLNGNSLIPQSKTIEERSYTDIAYRAEEYLKSLEQNIAGNEDLANIYRDFYDEIIEIGEENVFDTKVLLDALSPKVIKNLQKFVPEKFVPFYIDLTQTDFPEQAQQEFIERFKVYAELMSDFLDAGGSSNITFLDNLRKQDTPAAEVLIKYVSLTRPELGDPKKFNALYINQFSREFFNDLNFLIYQALGGDFFAISKSYQKSIPGVPSKHSSLTPDVPVGSSVSSAAIKDRELRKLLIDPNALVSDELSKNKEKKFLAESQKLIKGAKTRQELIKAVSRSQQNAISRQMSFTSSVRVSENAVSITIPVAWEFPDAEEVNGFKVRSDVRGKKMDDKYTADFTYDDNTGAVEISFKTSFFDYSNVPQYLNPNQYFRQIMDAVPYMFSDREVKTFTFAAVTEDHLRGFEPTTASVRPSSERRAILYNAAHQRAFDRAFDMRSKEDLALLVQDFGIYTLPAKGENNHFFFKQEIENVEIMYQGKERFTETAKVIKKYGATRIPTDIDLPEGKSWSLDDYEKEIIRNQVADYNAESKWGEALPFPKIYSPGIPVDAFAKTSAIEESKKIKIDKKFEPISAKIVGALDIVRESEEALYNSSENNKKNFMKDLMKRELWWDRQATVRKLIRDSHLEYVEAVMDAKQGYMANANKMFASAEERIYKGMAAGDVTIMDAIIYARRVIQVDTNFDNRKHNLSIKISQVESKIKGAQAGLANEMEKPSPDAVKIGNYQAAIESLDKTLADLKGQVTERPAHATPEAYKNAKIKYNKEAAIEDLVKIKNKIGDAKFSEISERVDAYFKEMNNIWLETFEAGLISLDEYNRFKNNDYAPRVFLQRILDEDPEIYDQEIMPKGLKESQIKAIKEGSEGLILTDSRMLMSMVIRSFSFRKFENVANSALATDALNPNNADWVREGNYKTDKDGNIVVDDFGNYSVSPADAGFKNAYYREGGRLRAIQLSNVAYDQWNDLTKSYFDLSAKTRKWARILSGTNIRKAMATGVNPRFAVLNAPAELGSVLLGRGVYDGYKFLPIMAYKLGMDYTKGLYQASKGYDSELLREAFSHGLGMTFLSSEGKPQLAAKKKYQSFSESMKGKAQKGIDTLSWLGEMTEIGLRLAVYKQAKENYRAKYPEYSEDRIMYLAAAEARRLTDFAAGGTLVKDLDNVAAYLNAAAQGFRANISYVKQNPGAFMSKFAQASIGVLGLAFYNILAGGDEYYNIPPYKRQAYWIIMNPFSKDENGNMGYWMFKKPQTFTGPIRAIEMIGESAANYYNSGETKEYDEAEVQMAYDAFADAYPWFVPGYKEDIWDNIGSAASRSATLDAIFKGVANYDTFRKRVISPDKGEVFPYMEGYGNDRIEGFYKAIGFATKDLPESYQISPASAKAVTETFITTPTNNIGVAMAYSLLNEATSGIETGDPNNANKTFGDNLKEMFGNISAGVFRHTQPEWRTYMKSTEVQEILMETASLDKKISVQLKTLAETHKGKKLSRIPSEVISYIETLDDSQKRAAVRRFTRLVAASEAEAAFYDVRFAPSPQAQAKLFLYHFGYPQPGTAEYKEVLKGLEAVGFRPSRDFKLALQEEIKRMK